MKKVLFLISTLSGGGAEKVLVDTVNSLDQNKYRITVQTMFDRGIYQEKLDSSVVYKTIISKNNTRLHNLVLRLAIKFLPSKLYDLYISDTYDYEIAFLEGLPTKVIAKSSNKQAKKVAWIHTDLIHFPGSAKVYGSEKMEMRAYEKFDQVICVSEAAKDSFVQKYGRSNKNVDVLYNVLDIEYIKEAAVQPVSWPSDITPRLISVGRLTDQKGYDRLLRIHKKLLDDGLMHSLVLLGEGSEREKLERYVKENELENTVFLLGFDSNPYKYMSKADLFVCSSRVEGFSTVASEAVLSGVPVISTAVSGAYEPVDMPRCSMVVENDEIALYEALRSILSEPQVIEGYKADLASKQSFWKKENLVAAFERVVFSED